MHTHTIAHTHTPTHTSAVRALLPEDALITQPINRLINQSIYLKQKHPPIHTHTHTYTHTHTHQHTPLLCVACSQRMRSRSEVQARFTSRLRALRVYVSSLFLRRIHSSKHSAFSPEVWVIPMSHVCPGKRQAVTGERSGGEG